MFHRSKILTAAFFVAIAICTANARAQTFPSPTIEQLILQFFGISNNETPIGVTDGNSSCLVRAPGVSSARYVVMPMRL